VTFRERPPRPSNSGTSAAPATPRPPEASNIIERTTAARAFGMATSAGRSWILAGPRLHRTGEDGEPALSLRIAAGEHVADAVDRANERGVVRVVFQLAAEPRHVDVHGARRGHRVVAPGTVEKLIAAEGRAFVLDEAAEELELPRDIATGLPSRRTRAPPTSTSTPPKRRRRGTGGRGAVRLRQASRRASSSATSKGRARKSSAPSLSPSTRSTTSAPSVVRMIGLVNPWRRRSRQTSRPLRRGSMTSRMTRSYSSESARASASSPSASIST